MQRLLFGWVPLFGLFIFQVCRAAESADVNSPASQSKEDLALAIKQVLDETNTPGAGVAIVSKDGIRLAMGLGLADRSSGKKVSTATMFRAGSISKSFTALAILKLQEEGRLSLDDRIRDLAPEVEFHNPWENAHPLRLVHVMEHTAGFNDISPREFGTSIPGSRVRDSIDFDPRPRASRWQPGTFFSYSNAGYAVAGFVVEKVSGQNFDDYVQEQILRPLDMPNASFLLTEAVEQELATGYGPDGSPSPYAHIVPRPSGALNCTPTELGHLVQMLLNRGTYQGKRILSAESIARMETPTTSVTARNGFLDGYGLGNFTAAHKGYRVYGHAGGIDGFVARYGYFPEHGVGYVIMLNAITADMRRIEDIVLRYLSREWPAAALRQPATASDDEISPYSGFYEPHTTRNEMGRFLDRLLGIVRVTADDGALRIGGLLGEPREYHTAQPLGSFRQPDEPGPTLLFFEDGGDMFAASTGLALGNLRRMANWQFWSQSLVVVYCATAMISALLFPLVWLPRLLFGRLRGRLSFGVRVLPLITVLGFLGIFVFVFLGAADPRHALGRPTLWSIGICVMTWLFAISTMASLVQVFRARHWDLSRWLWRHALVVSIANTIVLVYLAYWGIIGVRTWT